MPRYSVETDYFTLRAIVEAEDEDEAELIRDQMIEYADAAADDAMDGLSDEFDIESVETIAYAGGGNIEEEDEGE